MIYAKRLSDMDGAHELFMRCAECWMRQCGLDNEEVFDSWSKSVLVYPFSHGIALITDYVPGVKLTLHPLILNKKLVQNAPQMREILRRLVLFFNVTRVEVRLLENSGHTLRRLLRELGFTKEGTLRAFDVDHLKPTKPLISTEIWSIMRMEILEVSDG